MKLKKAICTFASLALVALPARAQHHFTASEARTHVGETATICGEVVSTRFAASAKGHPTFLNLEKPYPGQIFTIVIWGEDRSKFGTPEKTYRGKHLCVTGRIRDYRGMPEVIATERGQLRVDSK
jgi:DNA/RNA endonuclease YhcR with UshA esterase domain